jgi:hypothetical protein
MKKVVAVLVLLVVLLGTVGPSDAWGRGWGWGWGWGWRGGCCWWPGPFVGGFALGAAASPFWGPPVWGPPFGSPFVSTPVTWSAPVMAAAPEPAIQREVVFPHGRYLLFGDGVRQPWQWIWVPASAPQPPPPAAPR